MDLDESKLAFLTNRNNNERSVGEMRPITVPKREA